MAFSKVHIATELLIQKLPEWFGEILGNLFSKLKRIAMSYWQINGSFTGFIKFCDFVITRCNGNKFIEFELSNICNAQCVFCPYPDMLRTDKKFMHMSESILQENIQKLSHFSNALISFTPTTGDTLLHPEWDISISKILENKHISRATMFTNAIRLDEENRIKYLQILKSNNAYKMSELYFSVGGLDAETYKAMYKVDRFEVVKNNISDFITLLLENKICVGIHIHLKMPNSSKADLLLAQKLFNECAYPFVYFSFSTVYYSNDAYTRNGLIDYKVDVNPVKKKACAYLQKTRFAADGGIWADGCVISEMPGDNSLQLGTNTDSWSEIESKRKQLIDSWEQANEIPLPCRGCTVYKPR